MWNRGGEVERRRRKQWIATSKPAMGIDNWHLIKVKFRWGLRDMQCGSSSQTLFFSPPNVQMIRNCGSKTFEWKGPGPCNVQFWNTKKRTGPYQDLKNWVNWCSVTTSIEKESHRTDDLRVMNPTRYQLRQWSIGCSALVTNPFCATLVIITL